MTASTTNHQEINFPTRGGVPPKGTALIGELCTCRVEPVATMKPRRRLAMKRDLKADLELLENGFYPSSAELIETAGGYHWAIKGQEDDVIIKKRQYYNSKRVLCIDTGEIFDSVSEAGRELNINRKAIANNCNGMSKTAGGFKWEYI